MTTYKHTQVSLLILLITVPLLLFFAYMAITSSRTQGPFTFFTLLVAAVIATYATLTVELGPEAIRLRFGVGLLRKTIPLKDILNLRPERIPVLLSWGIRPYGNGWIYSVAGFDVVEIEMRNGKMFWIGTDEPETLSRAIENTLMTLRAKKQAPARQQAG